MGEGRALGWPGLLWAGQPKGCLRRTTIPSLPFIFGRLPIRIRLTFFFSSGTFLERCPVREAMLPLGNSQFAGLCIALAPGLHKEATAGWPPGLTRKWHGQAFLGKAALF